LIVSSKVRYKNPRTPPAVSGKLAHPDPYKFADQCQGSSCTKLTLRLPQIDHTCCGDSKICHTDVACFNDDDRADMLNDAFSLITNLGRSVEIDEAFSQFDA
jgi:hypothetical protein